VSALPGRGRNLRPFHLECLALAHWREADTSKEIEQRIIELVEHDKDGSALNRSLNEGLA
jgi:hypothetical protein